ncbi:MAG TPA: efflux RND transporter periplasmic adaptor subunit [Candidatus Kapabacteria bacterium]|nr:efflux RND transporter periplasmic adaptor subunit [Candidatus Kapabacteria bacterium]
MKSRNRILIIIIILVALSGAGYLVYSRVQSVAAEQQKRRQLAPLVQVQKPELKDFQQKFAYNGDVLPMQQANIFSRVSGNIEKMYADIGEYVHAGQLLAVVDSTSYAAQMRQNAGLLAQAKAAEQNAEATYKRSKDLFNQKLISQQDLDNASAALHTAQGQVEAQKAALENAEITLNYCKITAPFTGYITKRLLDPGVYVVVSPVGNSTLYTLQDMETVKIYIYVQERDIPFVDSIHDASVTLDAYPDKVFHGVVSKTSNSLDLATRSMTLEVDIDNKDHIIKPGMFATVSFVAATHHNAIVVPAEALQTDDQGRKSIFTVVDGKAKKVNVQTGIQADNEVEVTSGLSDSDEIIVLGQDQAKDGNAIRIAQQNQ